MQRSASRAYTSARQYAHLGRPRTKWMLTAEVPDVGILPKDFIAKRIPAIPREDVMAMLETATVTLNDLSIDWTRPLSNRDSITVRIPTPPMTFDPMTIDLDIMHDDGSLLVINKQAGICVQPSGEDQLNNILSALHSRYRNLEEPHLDRVPHLMHRIDRYTSGVLMLVWDSRLAKRAMEQFASRSVDKAYLALVHGVLKEREGVVDAPIKHDETSDYPLYFVGEGGRPSVTKWQVEEDFGHFSLVRFSPLTGRTHQIRVHSAHLGHPLLCDVRYGGQEKVTVENLSAWFGKESVALALGEERSSNYDDEVLSRVALHASHVQMTHPSTGEKFRAHAPLAKDMQAFVDICRKLVKPRIDELIGVNSAAGAADSDGAADVANVTVVATETSMAAIEKSAAPESSDRIGLKEESEREVLATPVNSLSSFSQ